MIFYDYAKRRMHAKCSCAFGTSTVRHDITNYTRAKIFSEVGKKTECFVRFPTVAGECGAADAERDIRGVAMKYYTEEQANISKANPFDLTKVWPHKEYPLIDVK